MTAGFVGPSISATMQADGTWTLNRKLVYHSDVTDKTYIVPRGFNTDYASTPRWPIVYWATGNTAHREATLHDFLYRSGIEKRTTCDAIFREAMKVTGVPAWRRTAMWLGVRLFGAPFHKHTGLPENVAPADAPANTDG